MCIFNKLTYLLFLPPSLQISLPPSVDSIRGFVRMLPVLQRLGDAYGF